MASGRFNISAENQYVNGYVKWTQSNLDSNNCTSNLNLKAYLHRTNNYSSSIDNQAITRKFFVDEAEFGITENITITLPSNQNYVLFYEKDITIYHNDDGSKNNLEIGFQSIYNGSAKTSFTVPKTTTKINLDTIPRYPGYVWESLGSKTEHTININWSTDSIADYVWYSINGSSWVAVGSTNAKAGNYTITGLKYNTDYKIRTRIRRKDSGLTGDSGELTVKTYDVPYATSTPNFTVGNTLTIPIYNPLGRKVKVYLVPTNGSDLGGDVITGTSISGYVNDTFKNGLYSASPNSPTNTYKVKTICDEINSTWTTSGSGIYTIPSTSPEFSNFGYLDCDDKVVSVTGSNQYIVKNKSNLRVRISSVNKMVAKNYATPSRYEISCANRTKSLNYSTSDCYVDLGTINSSGQMNIVVKAYDSRGFCTSVTKQINVIDYAEVNQENALYRINNFEVDSRLLIKGTFNLLSINNVSKNSITEIKYRYKELDKEYSEYKTVIPIITGNKYECELVNLDLDNSKSFLFEIIVSDKLGVYLKDLMLSEGIPIMFINKTKRNLGVGCVNKHEEGSIQATGNYYMKSGNKVLDYSKLSNIIKFEDNVRIDENNINHNFGKLIYNDTNTQGTKWSYTLLNTSSHFTYGNKIEYSENRLKITGAKYIRVSAKITFKEDSYSHENDIELKIGDEDLRFTNYFSARDYEISNLILQVSDVVYIGLGKYTGSSNDNLLTTAEDNYLCVEVIE